MPDQPELYKMRGVEGDFNVYVTSEFGVKELEAKPAPPPPEITLMKPSPSLFWLTLQPPHPRKPSLSQLQLQ